MLGNTSKNMQPQTEIFKILYMTLYNICLTSDIRKYHYTIIILFMQSKWLQLRKLNNAPC